MKTKNKRILIMTSLLIYNVYTVAQTSASNSQGHNSPPQSSAKRLRCWIKLKHETLVHSLNSFLQCEKVTLSCWVRPLPSGREITMEACALSAGMLRWVVDVTTMANMKATQSPAEDGSIDFVQLFLSVVLVSCLTGLW